MVLSVVQTSQLCSRQATTISPRPVAGAVRPLVHGTTIKYNSKVRIGRGFSMAEIKAIFGLVAYENFNAGIVCYLLTPSHTYHLLRTSLI